MAKATVKRRKSKAQRKEQSIRVRVTSAQKRKLSAAARKSGLGTSSWMLAVALREADAVASDAS
ncbi:DUF1778 domain-containing protein [Desulfobulbus sp. AH-315-M07]|nr:DUF1778 domain-containing protein [Desulfobulbus sp. AH-315-M07]